MQPTSLMASMHSQLTSSTCVLASLLWGLPLGLLFHSHLPLQKSLFLHLNTWLLHLCTMLSCNGWSKTVNTVRNLKSKEGRLVVLSRRRFVEFPSILLFFLKSISARLFLLTLTHSIKSVKILSFPPLPFLTLLADTTTATRWFGIKFDLHRIISYHHLFHLLLKLWFQQQHNVLYHLHNQTFLPHWFWLVSYPRILIKFYEYFPWIMITRGHPL